jgi:MscS family membrane protein
MIRVVTFAVLLSAAVSAQDTPAAPKPVPADELGRDSPRGTVVGFLRAGSAGDLTRAAQYLDLRGSRANPEAIAGQLHSVLNRSLSGDLAGLSTNPRGDLRDGLPDNTERVGSIRIANEVRNIELERKEGPEGQKIWLFSSATLRDIPRAYGYLDTPELIRSMPEALVHNRFLSIPLWRWLAWFTGFSVVVVGAWLATYLVFQVVLRTVLRRVLGIDGEAQLRPLRGSTRLFFTAMFIRWLTPLFLNLAARQFWLNAAVILAIIAIALLLIKASRLLLDLELKRIARFGRSNRIAVLQLMRQVFIGLVVLVAVLALLRRFGINVTAMLAGLGIGGVAVALAAQKTIENAFGGIRLILNDAARVGDTCRVAGLTGTVEDIGIGTMRLRTFDRTVVSVPNAAIAQVSLENYTLRDKFWFNQKFGLRYDTTPEQMESILSGIDKILRDDSKIEKSTPRVRFTGFGPSTQTIEIFAYVLEDSYEGFLREQQTLLLQILRTVRDAGASIAVPLAIANAETDTKTGSESRRDGT